MRIASHTVWCLLLRGLPRMIAAGCCLIVTGPGAVNAETLDEIVVTAQKREETLRDVPKAVSVVDGTLIDERSIVDLDSLSGYISNFSVGSAPITDTIAIRGVQSFLNPGFEQSVGSFVDGVYRGRGVQSRFLLLDAERVEVIKGPQGTLFGTNTIGGVVNVVSRLPSESLDAGVSVLHEFEADETIIDAHLSGPFSDNVRGRVALQTHTLDDGWLSNVFYNETLPRTEEWAARATLVWDAPNRATGILRITHADFDNGAELSEITIAAPPLGPAAPNGGVDSAFNYVTNTGNTTPEIDRGTAGFHDGDSDEVSLTWEQPLSERSEVTVIAAYSDYEFDRFFDPTSNPYDVAGFEDPESFEQLSLEATLASSNATGTFDYIIGVYALKNDLSSDAFSHVNVIDPLATLQFGDVDGDGDGEFVNVVDGAGAALFDAFASIGSPAAALFPFLNDFTRYTFLEQETTTRSVFGSGTLHFNDSVRATLGVRYSRTEKEGTQGNVCLPFGSRLLSGRDPGCELLPDFAAIQSASANLNPAMPDPAVLATLASLVNGRELALVTEAIAHISPLERNDNNLSWNFAPQWDVTPAVTIYGSLATGFKAGGFNAFAATALQTELMFQPEEVFAIELGAKISLLQGNADLNVAVFDLDYDDLQVSQFSGDTGFVVRNAVSASIRGVELDGRWRPADTMLVELAAAWNDFEWDNYSNAGCTVPQLAQSGLNASACATAGINDLSGRRQNAPSLTGNLLLTKQWAVGPYELQTRARINWTSNFTAALDLDPATRIAGLTLFDLDVRLQPQAGKWSAALLLSNVFDKRYDAGSDDVALFDFSYNGTPGRPRGIAFRVGYSFH